MNRFVFDVVARFAGTVVGESKEEVETKVREHIRQHPERLSVFVEKKSPCELLEEWEVKP